MKTRSGSVSLPDAKRHKGDQAANPTGVTDFVSQGRTVIATAVSPLTPPGTPHAAPSVRGTTASTSGSPSESEEPGTEMMEQQGRGRNAVGGGAVDDRSPAGTPPPLEPVHTANGVVFAPSGVAQNLLDAFALVSGHSASTAALRDPQNSQPSNGPIGISVTTAQGLLSSMSSSDRAQIALSSQASPSIAHIWDTATGSTDSVTSTNTAVSVTPGMQTEVAAAAIPVANPLSLTAPATQGPEPLVTTPITNSTAAVPTVHDTPPIASGGLPGPNRNDFGVGLLFPPNTQATAPNVTPIGFGQTATGAAPLAPGPGLGAFVVPTGLAAGVLNQAAVVQSAGIQGAVAPTAAALPPLPIAIPLPVPGPTPGLMGSIRALFDCVNEIPDAVLVRMFTIANHTIPGHNVYAVAHVPSGCVWGHGRHERMLCFNDTPMVIWLLGTAKSLWFFSRSGEPQARVNVGTDMAATRDYDAVKSLYQRARPRSAPLSETIYASRLQSARDRGEEKAHAVPFEEVYDASESLTSKSDMPRLSAVDIAENDIILVEASFTRWKKPADKKKKSWPSWDVGFELQAISLIYSPPQSVPQDTANTAAAGPVFSL